MSLRELATAACAPDGAGASSLNPLSRLADAILPAPLSGRPAPDLPSASGAGASSSSSMPPLSREEAALLAADASSNLDALSHATLPANAVPLASPVPPVAPPLLRHHTPVAPPPQFLSHPPSHLPPLQPIPVPAPGAPTDVFERAFRESSSGATAASRPIVSTTPTLPTTTTHLHAHAPPQTFTRPPPMNAYTPLHHTAHVPSSAPSWRTPDMLMSRLSLSQPVQYLGPQRTPVAMSPVPVAPIVEAAKVASETQPSTTNATAAASSAGAQSEKTTNSEESSATGVQSASSWGDEFTSFESAELSSVTHILPVPDEDIEIDRGIDALYADWLAASAAETGYTFSVGAGVRDASERAIDTLARAETARAEGRLAVAVRLFEAALQPAIQVGSESSSAATGEREGDQLEREDAARAWYLLGVTLAEADDDARAIRALEQGLSLFSGEARNDHPFLRDTLMALAVSHTNEGDGSLARAAVREWIGLHGGGGSERYGDGAANGEQESALMRELHGVAEKRPEDVAAFTMLGIMYNVRREYQQAAHMLRYAVQLQPGDATLWNKLGATLANGGRHEDALRAYRKAVDLRPMLIRAWVNVGTAYTNRNEAQRAARYYLKAIALAREQSSGGAGDEVQMRHVWGYVRSTLIGMKRPDLLELANANQLDALREHLRI